MTITRPGVVAAARATLGMTERPAGSNRCPISVWFGLIGPWCAMAVCKWTVDAGGPDLRRVLTPEWAYTPAGLAAGRRAGWAIPHRDARPGDIVFFNFSGDSGPEHVGLVTGTTPTHVLTIEGNTGGNDADGGQVQERRRPWSQVCGVLSPPYYADRPAPGPPPPAVPMEDPMHFVYLTLPGHPDNGKGYTIAGRTRRPVPGEHSAIAQNLAVNFGGKVLRIDNAPTWDVLMSQTDAS